jgi:predicted transcriptional regulator
VKAVLLSVRPVFARSLLAGTKTAEVRRRFPDLARCTELFVYSSTPDRSVLGSIRLSGIHRTTPSEVWDSYGGEIDIARDELTRYLAGTDDVAVLSVTQPVRWPNAVPLESLRTRIGIEPPQSFRYLTQEQAESLRRLGTDIPITRAS